MFKCPSFHSLLEGRIHVLNISLYLPQHSVFISANTERKREDRQPTPTLRNVLCGSLTTGMVNSLGSTFSVALWVFSIHPGGLGCRKSLATIPMASLLCILSVKGLYKMGLL